MAGPNLNYFTCTLGQAALLRKHQGDHNSFQTVLTLIEEQAGRLPGHHAIGFADHISTHSARRPPNQVTFSELRDLSIAAATVLADTLSCEIQGSEPPTVGLLCASNLDFILTWLGLMRLGCRVFLLAPQLESPAVRHLCAVSNMRTILVGDGQEEKFAELRGSINLPQIPSYFAGSRDRNLFTSEEYSEESDVAYIGHTSGTSSGLPKPILQGQWGAVGCLPSFPHTDQPATFTTTPLYHGGLADCLRAWTSGAMIWFFPEGVAPITGGNIVRSMTYARDRSLAPIKYFSSVPYVLQLLAEEHEGICVLKNMDLVGVGGAALAPSVGDRLVGLGINLLSRMGSAECGFLMSSHRNYSKDKEWQYLRPVDDAAFLSFEPRGDGLSELVVKARWPLISKTNRDDGSYATADLFEAHPSIPNAWRYHSRADAQITLANGKKFDPSLEEEIKASTKLVSDVLVFGAGREYAGALLFKASDNISNDDVINATWLQIKASNKETQSHSRLARSMLVVVGPNEVEEPLAKSSKGTVLRRQAETRFADIIDAAYSTASRSTHGVSDADLPSAILNLFNEVLDREIDPHRDLFQQGVDSIACVQIRKHIESSFLPQGSPTLPTNIIYDSGNINVLSKNVIQMRKGGSLPSLHNDASEWRLMRELSEKYSHFDSYSIDKSKKHGAVILLTGTTGLLGAHILSILCGDATVRRIYCLIRGRKERVLEALSRRELSGLEELEKPRDSHEKVVFLPCELSDPRLGVSEAEFSRIVAESTVIIHASWAVNFSLLLSSFETHILGTRNLITTAVMSGARFFFISSTAAVSCDPSRIIAEKASSEPSHAAPLGYSRSKWVAEQMCSKVHNELFKNMSPDAAGRTDISIIRVGQLCGNEAGIWNESEAYPLMLSTADFTGCLPDLPNEPLSWLPVDQAAKIILEIALLAHGSNAINSSEMSVYHVLNVHKSPSWSQLLHWVSDIPGYPSFRTVRPVEWLQQLESRLGKSQAGHPSQALLGLWRRKYTETTSESKEGEYHSKNAKDTPSFSIASSSRLSRAMRDIKPLNRERVLTMWKWIQENVGRVNSEAHLADPK
ncbi:acetyl-CoA synthetase-like protein [Hypoxylon crocopeplum]|nr:acetyl-CoA synthetase-like protein [Hypoxylon crocopeplum]